MPFSLPSTSQSRARWPNARLRGLNTGDAPSIRTFGFFIVGTAGRIPPNLCIATVLVDLFVGPILYQRQPPVVRLWSFSVAGPYISGASHLTLARFEAPGGTVLRAYDTQNQRPANRRVLLMDTGRLRDRYPSRQQRHRLCR